VYDNTLEYPFSSRRNCVISKNGVVATSNPLAAQAGLDILKKGGNAVDAAVATAICLTVVEPTSNGIGGDNFAIISRNGKIHGLNSSGYSPAGISVESLLEKGLKQMPRFGWAPVTVPGAPKGWATCVERFGNLSLSEVAQPAVEYAEKGFPVQPTVSENWQRAAAIYRDYLREDRFQNWFDTFLKNGKAPSAGELMILPEHADTIRKIADTNAEAFYSGELMEKIVRFSNDTGGYFTEEDFKTFSNDFVKPIGIDYRGYTILEIPPNGQGIVALEALGILNGLEINRRDTDYFHNSIESIKLAFSDGKRYVTQAEKMAFDYNRMLDADYLASRRRQITSDALQPEPGSPEGSGTVYLATADNEGNMVSFIQSNYMGFGSGLVVPGTGIGLQNRGHSFSFNKRDANSLEPSKRPYHTIIPGFITKDERPVGPFGVMGGFMQPQGHLQVVSNLIDFNLNPQAALDAPRWQWMKDKEVVIEKEFPTETAKALSRKGHKVSVSLTSGLFGRGQIILRNDQGLYISGTEKRTDGCIAAY